MSLVTHLNTYSFFKLGDRWMRFATFFVFSQGIVGPLRKSREFRDRTFTDTYIPLKHFIIAVNHAVKDSTLFK